MDTLTLATYPTSVLAVMSQVQFRESLSYVGTDIVIPESSLNSMFLHTYSEHETEAALTECPLTFTHPDVIGDEGIQFVAYPRNPSETLTELEDSGQIDTGTLTYVLTDLLSIDIDFMALETTITGLDEYSELVNTDELEGEYIHLITNAGPNVQTESEGFEIRGIMPGKSEGISEKEKEIAILTCLPDGSLSTKTRSIASFGLEKLEQVGRKRAHTLRKHGYQSVEDIANESQTALAELPGIHDKAAREIHASALSNTNSGVERLGVEEYPLEGEEPVFIDIETDGLSPTMVWLIGALDSETDTYVSFLAKNPEMKGKALAEFMTWYTTHHSGKPLVAYNGVTFDFTVLDSHIQEHTPDFYEEYTYITKFDPYWWGVKNDNILLPGETNKLEDVAEALGYSDFDTGLSGAVVGERFRQWMNDPCDETELDWERHKRYCETDVRALKHIHDAILDASGTMTDGQQGLSQFM